MISPARDKELMGLALDLSKQSRAESDGRVHPFVGAVIVNSDGVIISNGHRGQHTPGNHAEQEALIGLRDDVVKNAIVYSTLEPCTFRGKQTPCCLRLIDKNISEVVIGILDPNRDIRGMGWWKFMEKGIRVRTFHKEFVEEIRTLNAAFIDDQLGPGLVVTEVQPVGSEAIAVSDDHRAGRASIQIKKTSHIVVRGIYRTRPPEGHRIHLFVRRVTSYHPQAPINFRYDRDNRMWECPSASLQALPVGTANEIVLADLSDDLMVAVRHYSDVYSALEEKAGLKAWVGIQMDPEPPGFKKLAGVTISVLPLT
jgi:pyrimidine deaminase RibD-like protein